LKKNSWKRHASKAGRKGKSKRDLTMGRGGKSGWNRWDKATLRVRGGGLWKEGIGGLEKPLFDWSKKIKGQNREVLYVPAWRPRRENKGGERRALDSRKNP